MGRFRRKRTIFDRIPFYNEFSSMPLHLKTSVFLRLLWPFPRITETTCYPKQYHHLVIGTGMMVLLVAREVVVGLGTGVVVVFLVVGVGRGIGTFGGTVIRVMGPITIVSEASSTGRART